MVLAGGVVACPLFLPWDHPSRVASADPRASALASFTWTAGGSDDLWHTTLNWSASGGFGYPDDSTDDAIFDDYCFHTEFDASRTIDDLNVDVSGEFCIGEFDANGTAYTLTCDTVTITGNNDGIRVVEKAGIETN